MATGTVVKRPKEMERWKVDCRRPLESVCSDEAPLQARDDVTSDNKCHHKCYVRSRYQ